MRGIRSWSALLLLVALLSACGSNGGNVESTGGGFNASGSRIKRCVDRLLENASAPNETMDARARRYARDTYCARFAKNGWIYSNGALSIAAQKWLDAGTTCVGSSPGSPATTMPCSDDSGGGIQTLDCALLHIVRRSEVKDYVRRLAQNGPVHCDDGTALDQLGVP